MSGPDHAETVVRADSGQAETIIDRRTARLSLEQKARLLTGMDFWWLPAEPGVGLRRVVVSDGPAGGRGQQS